MYICEKHGNLETEWCADCGEFKRCDCSDITCTRIKDFIYDTDCGERTVTIYLHYCRTCGDPTGVELA